MHIMLAQFKMLNYWAGWLAGGLVFYAKVISPTSIEGFVLLLSCLLVCW